MKQPPGVHGLVKRPEGFSQPSGVCGGVNQPEGFQLPDSRRSRPPQHDLT